MDDARALQANVTGRDKEKLEEYLTSVREIEKRIEKSERFGPPANPDVASPSGVPASFEEYIHVMYDMMALAFQTDSTRVATFLLANEGSNRAFPEIDIAEGHHFLTHHQNKQDMIDKVSEIDLFYMRQFARFLDKLDKTKDFDGNSLLQNSVVLYGSGNSDANRHTHVNLPVILAGGAGGTLKPGRFVKSGGVPMSNLLLSIADRLGAKGVERHGDSTGRFEGIA
jgi:hypothetical protein